MNTKVAKADLEEKAEQKPDVEANDRTTTEAPKIKPCTDLGNAERLVKRFGKKIRYCSENKRWYVFGKGRWNPDPGSKLFRMACIVAKSIEKEAGAENLTFDQRVELLKHSKKSASKGRLQAMVELVKWLPGILVPVGRLDRDPWLLNCQNGTVDLRTGELKPHDPDDLITKMLPIKFEPDATCPVWEATIDKIMAGDQEKITFLSRVFGYGMTGVISEQCMFVFYGSGANGKSTILEIYRELLAGYAMHTTTASLLGSSGSPIRNDLARLNGARFVSAVEIGMGKKLDEALVKQLTGGDQVTARFLYNEYFEYRPEFKLFIASNHKPEIRGVDHGIWRRIHLVPFSVTIPAEEIDRDLPVKLRAELPGILSWAVRGCRQWQQQGLNVPASIAIATKDYRHEMDTVGDCLNDLCSFGAGKKAPMGILYANYREWADEACQDALGKKDFGKLMIQKAFGKSKSGSTRYWEGLELKPKDSKTGEQREAAA